MKTTLSPQALLIVKSSATLITQNDTKISTRMYEILFSKYPKVKKLFENAPANQYMKLAEILSAYAANIDRIERLKPALLVIAKAHVRLNIQPAQYPMIGMVLMQAIEETLGEKATPEFMDAWREAYKYISYILIEMERELYEQRKQKL